MTLLKRLQEEARELFHTLQTFGLDKDIPQSVLEAIDYVSNYVGDIANDRKVTLDEPKNAFPTIVTAVLDEVENEARDLYLESDDENYQRALTDIKAIIGNLKRTEI